MKVSKSSWHYRFNDYFQSNFAYRAERSTFTTCTYIRTTIRTFFQATAATAFVSMLILMLILILGSAVYWPVAAIFGLPLAKFTVPFAVGTYCAIGAASIVLLYEKKLKPKLEARREQKLSLLRQAVLDRKEGICTIVRFE